MPRAGSTDRDLVEVDAHGVAHPVGGDARLALQRHENCVLALIPSPAHVVVMRAVPLGAQAETGKQLWMSGEITSSSRLLDIMGMVAQAKWRGELVIDDGVQPRSIFVHGGHVLGASSTAEHERLGEMLRRYGEIGDEQLERASQEITGEVSFGDAAVRLGFVGQETLFRYLRRQTEEIVYASLTVTHGSFSFYEHIHELPLTFPLRVSLVELMLEGVRRMDAIEGFRDSIPSNEHVPTRVEGCIVDAADDTYAVYLAVNGDRSVEEVAAASGKGMFETIHQLHALERRRAIRIRPPRPAAPEGMVATFNDAVRLIVVEGEKCGTAGREIRRMLELFAASSEAHAALFAGAGPDEDGSVDAARVLSNLEAMGLADADGALAGWLYEYGTYAMFVAEPVLRAGAGREAAAIASRVARLLTPLAPDF